jgi:hypothetical protein
MRLVEYVAMKNKDNKTVKFNDYKINRKDGAVQVIKDDKVLYTTVFFD